MLDLALGCADGSLALDPVLDVGPEEAPGAAHLERGELPGGSETVDRPIIHLEEGRDLLDRQH